VLFTKTISFIYALHFTDGNIFIGTKYNPDALFSFRCSIFSVDFNEIIFKNVANNIFPKRIDYDYYI